MLLLKVLSSHLGPQEDFISYFSCSYDQMLDKKQLGRRILAHGCEEAMLEFMMVEHCGYDPSQLGRPGAREESWKQRQATDFKFLPHHSTILQLALASVLRPPRIAPRANNQVFRQHLWRHVHPLTWTKCRAEAWCLWCLSVSVSFEWPAYPADEQVNYPPPTFFRSDRLLSLICSHPGLKGEKNPTVQTTP